MNGERYVKNGKNKSAFALKKEKLACFLKKKTCGARLFYIGFFLCLAVLGYTLFYLLTLGDFGNYGELTLKVGVLIEHALALLTIGLGGCLLFDLLDRWEKRSAD